MKLSQKQKILTIMTREPNRWFYPYDFMRNDLGQYFVGYKAGTRLSELEHDYPGIFETKSEGKYVLRKLNKERMAIIFNTLPKDLRYAIHRTGYKIERPDAETTLTNLGYTVLPFGE